MSVVYTLNTGMSLMLYYIHNHYELHNNTFYIKIYSILLFKILIKCNLFYRGKETSEYEPGSDLSFLLTDAQ